MSVNVSGKYKGYSRLLLIISISLLTVYPYVWLFLFDGRDLSAAGALASFSPIVLGLVTGGFTFRLPCRIEADEKTFTIITAGIKRSFRIGTISEISCEYRRHDMTKTKATLTVTDGAGRKFRFAEIHNVDIAYLKFDEKAEKPQLKKLCDYVHSARGE